MKMRGRYRAVLIRTSSPYGTASNVSWVEDTKGRIATKLLAKCETQAISKRIARALNLLEETERKRARMPVLCAPGFADELVGAVKKLERKRAGKGKRR